MIRSLAIATTALVAPAWLASGCGDIEVPPSNCAAGEQVSCPCAGGIEGTQTCEDSGLFGACECPEPIDDDSGDAGGPDVEPDGGEADATPDATPDASDVGADQGPELPGPDAQPDVQPDGEADAEPDVAPDVPEPACASDLDCDDDNPCTLDVCTPGVGVCVYAALEGKTCDDGNLCTGPDACSAEGVCEGAPIDCDDGLTCSVDYCDAFTGACVNEVSGCGCTSDAECDDGNACTADACDVGSGKCDNAATPGALCADGDPCTEGDLCDSEGACVGTVKDCADQVACTVDSCDVATGECLHDTTTCTCLTNAECDDGKACTNDLCDLGTSTCLHEPDPANACNDGDPCTVNDACGAAGGCAGTAILCDDGDPCTADGCDPASGACASSLTVGAECDDGDPCTGVASCKADGSCSGPAVSCNDNNPCTTDYCDPATGFCTSDPDPSGVCNDGDPCTVGDACDAAGQCMGTSKPCDDGNVCTSDSCGADGACQHSPLAGGSCDDGSPCTEVDTCQANGQCSGTAKDCDDGQECTVDGCNPASGACVHDASACDCTTDAQCEDANSCTIDQCVAGGCVSTDLDAGTPCDDGNPCTLGDVCSNSGSCAGTPNDCDDGEVCTQDVCVPGLDGACDHAPLVGTGCSDGDPCTLGDTCEGEGGCQGTPKACNDNNDCTSDSCDGSNGQCVNSPEVGKSCDDGNLCSDGDACDAGGGCSGAPVDCDDSDPCTTDACSPASGCGNVFVAGTPCDDGTACTFNDACVEGKGCTGTPTSCNDGDACTDDDCDAATGACVHTTVDGQLCDDGNVCTQEDFCDPNGVCVGIPVDCDDGVACTLDLCDSVSGGCKHIGGPNTGLGWFDYACLGVEGLPEGDVGALTIEAWIWPDSNQPSGNGPVRSIFRAHDGEQGVDLMWNKNNNGIEVRLGGVNFNFGALAPYSLWTHVALQVDPDQAGVWLFVNGVLEGEQSWTGGELSLPPQQATIGCASLGGFSQSDQHFDGAIDELRVSQGLRYPLGQDFDPYAPIFADAATLLMMHFPFNLEDASGNTSAGWIVGFGSFDGPSAPYCEGE